MGTGACHLAFLAMWMSVQLSVWLHPVPIHKVRHLPLPVSSHPLLKMSFQVSSGGNAWRHAPEGEEHDMDVNDVTHNVSSTFHISNIM